MGINASRHAEKIGKHAPAEPPLPNVDLELTGVYSAPVKTVQGRDAIKVVVCWKNTGNRPIRLVEGRIYLKNDDRDEVMVTPGSYTLWVAFDNEPGVAPGETHVAGWDKEGFLVLPQLHKGLDFTRPTKVRVSISKVSEHGIKAQTD